jgi:hypothetical protein
MTKSTVFIDESGTLPNPKDRVVIVAAVGTQAPEKLLIISKSVRKFQKKKNAVEIKFYKAGERTKKKFLENLASQDLEIFVLIVEKQGKKIDDSPENFALLCWLILEECLLFYEKEIKEVVFDRHFDQKKDQELFNHILSKLLGQKIDFTHADSQKDSRVNAADMVAGSLLWLKTGKDPRFYELIKPKIISEKSVNWRQIKKKFWHKKMSEPTQASIQTIEQSLKQTNKFVNPIRKRKHSNGVKRI